MANSVRLELVEESVAEANRLAADLLQHLRATQDAWEITRTKADSQTMDAGTILVAVLAAPAVVALAKEPAKELAKGLAEWLTKRRVTIAVDGQKVKIENVPAQDAVRMLELILAAKDAP